MSRVIVLAGGSPHAHDFDRVRSALVDHLRRLGHEVEAVDDPDVAATRLSADPPDALVVCGLWWTMTGDAYAAWRDRFAYSPGPSTRAALSGFVAGGGGLVALHTTPICFDDWPGWGDVVGGAWRWGVSSHPPYGPVRATVASRHPVVDGLPSTFELSDEVYGDLDIRDTVEVLATATRQPGDDDQPVVWAHHYGRGRVVFDCFGHDAESICQPDNARLIGQAVDWVTEDR